MTQTNNIGFLRLLFAYLVILSHSPLIIDEDLSREVLYHLTGGAVDLGGLALNGFFLLSGYLIFQSYKNSISFFNWIIKRVLRIYPAFIVVWLVCVFIFVPLAGATHLLLESGTIDWARMIVKVLFLAVPHVEGLHEATGIVTINGSLWTIRYEFLCYLLIPLIALFGLNNKNILLVLFISIVTHLYTKIYGIDFTTDTPFNLSAAHLSRLASAFLIGICFFKFKERIVWSRTISFICFICLIASFHSPIFASLGFSLFGGYLLFNFAFNFKNTHIQNINNTYDISYGVYIYAWPIQALITQNNLTINPWLLSFISIILASALGYLSWKIIEKPFLNLKKYIPLRYNVGLKGHH